MSSLKLTQEDNWVVVNGIIKKQFSNYLKYEIKPLTYRKFDAGKGKWLFYHTKLNLIAPIAKKIYGHVDWSELPTTWQMMAAGATPPNVEIPPLNDSPYQQLYLVNDAPLEVVRSAYKTLVKMYHPDVGGDLDKIQQINVAYEEILKNKNL